MHGAVRGAMADGSIKSRLRDNLVSERDTIRARGRVNDLLMTSERELQNFIE